MRKKNTERIKGYDFPKSLIGLELEKAREIAGWSGYNISEEEPGEEILFTTIFVKVEDSKITETKLRK